MHSPTLTAAQPATRPASPPAREAVPAVGRLDAQPGSISRWIILLVWSVPAVLSTFETITFSRLAGRPMPVWRAFIGEAPQWYGWAVLTPIVVILARRYPLTRIARTGGPSRAWSAMVHVLAAVAAGLALAFGDAVVNHWVRPSPSGLFVSTRNWFFSGLPATALVYVGIVLATYAWTNAVRLSQRERAAAALEARLRDAQLGALRMQLQPHFLFNSLNSVMALVRDQETDRAIQALSLLSDVLRATVHAGDAAETTLAAELDFVTRYLDIEQIRFGDRLRVTIDVDDALHDARVPVFILQPFVENALKHGVLRDRGGNEIAIRSRAQGDTLVLEVRDDGRGLPGGTAIGPGVGLLNARRRLEHMYGSAAKLSVANAASSRGVVVNITLPLRRAASLA